MKIKKIYKPNREFKERTKAMFLSAYKLKFPRPHEEFSHLSYFMKGVAFGGALVVIFTASATYADQKNVAVDNALYPLKRSAEFVKVLFTSELRQPEAHLALAERRLNEIKAIKIKDPKAPQIPNLIKNLEREVLSSIQTIESAEFKEPESKIKKNGSSSESFENKVLLPRKNEPGSSTIAIPPVSSSLPASEDSDSQDNPKKKTETGKSETDKISVTPKAMNRRDASICESWRAIVAEKDSEVVGVVNRIPDLLKKFETKCEKSDSSPKTEVEAKSESVKD